MESNLAIIEIDQMRLELALEIAVKQHAGQRDKAGQPYIFHVLRVMLACESPEEKIVAALHDVVEDSAWTVDDIRGRFPNHIADAVEAISKLSYESRQAYMARVMRNPLARAVKRHDLMDNMNLYRLPEIRSEDLERNMRYRYDLEYLGG